MPRGETKAATPLMLDDIMKEIKASTKDMKMDIKKLTTTEKDVNATLKNYMEKTDNKIKELRTDNDAVTKRVDDLEEAITDITDKLTAAETRVKEHEKVIDMLARKNIDGIKEEVNKHPRQQVIELLADINANIRADDISAVLRLGVGKPNSVKPRPILVKFTNSNNKQELFRNIRKLGESDKWKQVYVQDDLPYETQQERKEMRCLAALARERGHDATVKGNALIVDGAKYLYKDCDNLPEGITMVNAKLVEVEDRWAFQSHHAFPSNMAPFTIEDDGHDYHCGEQLYWYKCAEDAEDQCAMGKICDCKTGYDAKRIGHSIEKKKRWSSLRKPVMEKILKVCWSDFADRDAVLTCFEYIYTFSIKLYIS